MKQTYDTIIKGGMVVSAISVTRADVGIIGESIAAVGDLGSASAGTKIEADGRYIIPGVIDVHSHPVYSDDLAGMCLAGASAGVTAVVPYVGAFPSWGFEKTNPLTETEKFIARWDGQVACDFGVHVAIDATDDLASQIDGLLALGVPSFKFFMAYRTRGMMVDDAALIRNFGIVARHGGMAAVHAENGAGIAYLEDQWWEKDDVPNDVFLRCHTDLFETEAILRAAALADATGCTLYIPHVAAAEGVEVIRMARRMSRAPIFAETCPHYLLLTNEEVLRRGSLSKIAPPLRLPHDNAALWTALAAGDLEVVGTDHAGRTVAVKGQGKNLLQQPYGSEGIEHLLPLIYTHGVVAGRIDIRRMVEVLSEKPADIFGLAPRKGRLVPGADADVVVLDPAGARSLSASDHVGASDYCLYEGWETRGTVEVTMRRGQFVYRDGQPQAVTGGCFQQRRLAWTSPVLA